MTVILSAYFSVNTLFSSRYTATAVVSDEQVPSQYQLIGRDVMLVRHCSITELPKVTSLLCGTTSNAASL